MFVIVAIGRADVTVLNYRLDVVIPAKLPHDRV